MGVPILLAGNYRMGLLFILLLAIPIIRMLNQAPKKVVIDFSQNLINDIPFAEINEFKYESEESLAYATPFEKGTTEYALHLDLINQYGLPIRLLSFIDREQNKPGAEDLLSTMNGWLNKN